MSYNTFDYFSIEAYEPIRSAHQELVRRHRPSEERVRWYWDRQRSPERNHHREEVGPFRVHSGPVASLPVELVAVFLDSQVKTYMDRDALGDAVRRLPQNGGVTPSTIAARERELARRIGGGGLESPTLLMALVERCGYVLGGMIVNPGTVDCTVAEVMKDPSRTFIAAFQAKFKLADDDPFARLKEDSIVDLVRYFRAPDALLRKVLPPRLLERIDYRKTVHLIRALTICEAFAMTERWMRDEKREITSCVCETPNDDVKALIEGKRLRRVDGSEVRVDAIPHRVLTSSSGLELYPAAYRDRPEGKSKIYTLYAFDFAQIAARAKEYRRQALLACDELYASGAA